jgi:hypothetical protein
MTRGVRASSEKYMDTETKESEERAIFPGMEMDSWNAVGWPTYMSVSQKRTDVLTVGDVKA